MLHVSQPVAAELHTERMTAISYDAVAVAVLCSVGGERACRHQVLEQLTSVGSDDIFPWRLDCVHRLTAL